MRSDDGTAAMKDRIIGCLLAGAVGDAIGAHFENAPPSDDFRMPDVLRITDDTQLTLATCEAIMETGAVDPKMIADRFVAWYRERRLSGIGASTLKALIELDAGGHWASCGATGERSAGNGAAMRIAPLAFLLDPDNDADRRTIRDVSRITHRNDEAHIGAVAIIRSVRYVLHREPDERMLKHLIDRLPDSRVRDRLVEIADATPISVRECAARFGASGYVADSVPLAILAATQSTGLLESIANIAGCGGDADTIASMFGQIRGAAHGASCVPRNVAERLNAAPPIRETITRFADAVISSFDH